MPRPGTNSQGGFLLPDETADQQQPLLGFPTQRRLCSQEAQENWHFCDENDFCVSSNGKVSQENSPALFDSIPKSMKNPSFFCSNNMRLYYRIILYLGAIASVTFLLYASLTRDSTDKFRVSVEKGDGDDKDQFVKLEQRHRVKVEIYMESQCPDTTRFMNTQLMPSYDELYEFMDLKIIPFGKAKWSKLATPEEDYSFQCQHGPRECVVNQLMCCGIDRLKRVEKYLPYVACIQATPPGGQEQEKCNEKFGFSNKEMQECANGREGRVLHHKMGELTKALKPSAFFIPWIVIDGVREKRAFTEFKTVVCEKLASNFNLRPEPCQLTLLTSTALMRLMRSL